MMCACVRVCECVRVSSSVCVWVRMYVSERDRECRRDFLQGAFYISTCSLLEKLPLPFLPSVRSSKQLFWGTYLMPQKFLSFLKKGFLKKMHSSTDNFYVQGWWDHIRKINRIIDSKWRHILNYFCGKEELKVTTKLQIVNKMLLWWSHIVNTFNYNVFHILLLYSLIDFKTRFPRKKIPYLTLIIVQVQKTRYIVDNFSFFPILSTFIEIYNSRYSWNS